MHCFSRCRPDAIIATNTLPIELVGGLSGRVLFSRSLHMVKQLSRLDIPSIACGGIMDQNDANLMLDNGASLVQVCTGPMLYGPEFFDRFAKL